VPVRLPEHLAGAAGQVGERGDNTLVQGNAASLAILGLRKLNVGAAQVYIAPIKP
jgi:hypothetical protein